MTYDENMMLEYIEYLSTKMYKYDPEFDGYVRIDAGKCQSNKGLNSDQQKKAITSLYKSGVIDGRREGPDWFVKIIKKQTHDADKWHKPRDEAERRVMKLAYHPEVLVKYYSRERHVSDYLEIADKEYPDPPWWHV